MKIICLGISKRFSIEDMEELYGESRQAAGFSEDVSGGQ